MQRGKIIRQRRFNKYQIRTNIENNKILNIQYNNINNNELGKI